MPHEIRRSCSSTSESRFKRDNDLSRLYCNLRTMETVQGIIRLLSFALLASSLLAFSPRRGLGQYSFDDEFNGTSLDTTAWVPLNRPGDSSGNEQQYLLPSNQSVSGGN